ncbi:nuclear receptor subfamily 0 group B member 2-like [Sceloporus undulatus]|uniref:nuclear receptor subfamily 0 group B member 2-like n=1 Tax=Sceloporus undulatus TaxID=8520 RepID=UPI001C4B0CB6|nr:nuclear receptor subfamily 0 group B member 2-like [Sceloporus undulatus]
MAFQGPFEKSGKYCSNSPSPTSILYGILNSEEQRRNQWTHHDFSLLPLFPSVRCPCRENRRVVLKTPDLICVRASEVLLKTVTFIRNLPTFFQLPPEDQILLTEQCWAPLFILGLAQEQIDFELEETSVPSLLKMILLNQTLTDNQQLQNYLFGASLMEVQKLKNFLRKLWDSDVCAKEYAYLKGIVLFNPGFQDLKCRIFIQTLQQEAQQTLMEFISMIHCRNLRRYTWLMELLGLLRSFHTNTIGDLFFKPFLGDVNLSSLFQETLYSK